MCRLCFIPNTAKITRKQIRGLFEYLESQMGGDGNGVAAVFPNPSPSRSLCYKGTDVAALKAADIAYGWHGKGAHVVFHTRISTCGKVSDANCQPFLAGPYVIAHNGMWSEGVAIAASRNRGESDSRAFAVMCRKHGLAFFNDNNLWPPTGVWLFIGKKWQRVLVPYWAPEIMFDPVTAIWASAFPCCSPWREAYDVDQGYHDLIREDAGPVECKRTKLGYGFTHKTAESPAWGEDATDYNDYGGSAAACADSSTYTAAQNRSIVAVDEKPEHRASTWAEVDAAAEAAERTEGIGFRVPDASAGELETLRAKQSSYEDSESERDALIAVSAPKGRKARRKAAKKARKAATTAKQIGQTLLGQPVYNANQPAVRGGMK